jgi:uncharacterized protein (DUF2384 family)
MTDLDRVLLRLAEYYTPAERAVWLNRPHPQLAGQRPIMMIGRGRAAEVEAIIDRLDSAAYL